MAPQRFTLPQSGEEIQLRAMTGYEILLLRKMFPDDELERNLAYLAMCLGGADGIDNSGDLRAVLVAQGTVFAKRVTAGDFKAAMDFAEQVSGLSEGAGKSAVLETGA